MRQKTCDCTQSSQIFQLIDALGVFSEVREGIIGDDAFDVVNCHVSAIDGVDTLVVSKASHSQPRLDALPLVLASGQADD
jgi:hypothetical protein